jgi:Ca2+-binding RTX toxin-like protein
MVFIMQAHASDQATQGEERLAAALDDSGLKVERSPEGVKLTWFAREGAACQVEFSADLVHWTPVGPLIAGTDAWVSRVAPPIDGASPATGFFRVKDVVAAALAAESEKKVAPSAVTAIFATVSGGILSVIGDNADNTISVGRDPSGALLVNGGAVPIRGGAPTVANTQQIQIFGMGGNDALFLDEANGAMPGAALFGGSGDDVLNGGTSGDLLFGQGGNDRLLGRGGSDFLFGGPDHDVLIGGDADDLVFGEGGNDRFIWNPGDDTDLNEGGAGDDTVEINGGGGAEVFTATANGTRVRFDRVDPAPFSVDIGACENLVLNANGGDDRFSATGNLAALIRITVDGGPGNDTLLGSNGVDLLLGGDGDDFIDGQQGNDVVFLGAGNDTFQWDPGDGSDTVEGQEGIDRLVFNGSAGNEIFNASANGGRARFTRNLGNIVMDLDGIEQIDLHALNGTDTIIIDNLAGTDVAQFNVRLAGVLGGSGPDAQADVVIVNASTGDDIIDVLGSGTSYSVVGLAALVSVSDSSGADDSLVINALSGNDGITASTLPAGVVKLTLDGGAGDDTLIGSAGADVFLGGAGNDFVMGLQGDDLALLGADDDVFQWEPGHGSDTVEGQTGTDAMRFFGSAAAENIDVLANGGRVLFLNVASVTMDLNDVEEIEFRPLGGADNINIGDLSGTDMKRIELNLRGPAGGGDGEADSVTVAGTQSADVFGVLGDAGGVRVFGLAATIDIFSPEQANDRLILNGLGGDDVIDATSLEADGIQLTMNGGLGNDVLIGSEGADVVNGGDGNDVALLGAGDDTFVWNPGDDNDVIEGQAGSDTMLFNGSNVAENIDISLDGTRVRFFRNVAAVLMDLNGVETINFNALGGADVIVVHDLTGSSTTAVNLNLGTSGAGDAQPDTVIVEGTSGDDSVLVTGTPAAGAKVSGLAAEIAITLSEPANDRLTIHLLAGNDSLDASGLSAGVIQLTADGGAGNDFLIGSAGPDVLLGGAGDDTLVGGPALDVLDGGSGTNSVTQ